MKKDVIGTNAGVVWTVLSETKELPFKTLKKAAKLKEKELYLALGWLAREEKINFVNGEEDLIIELC